MTINLKPEQERIILAEIESGHFRSPDEVLDYALAALQEKAGNAHPDASKEFGAVPIGIATRGR